MSVRRALEEAGIPPADLHGLPSSEKRFPDGAQYRFEIPSTEGPRCLDAVLDEADRLDVPIHRISQGSGVFLLTDAELERILQAAAEAGARSAAYVLLRLPYEVKDLFREWLDGHEPLKAKHVISRIHSMRGGRDNDPRWTHRLRGEGEYADLLARRFTAACRRFGLNQRGREMPLRTDLFIAPRAGEPQLDLGL